jgi:integrase
MMNVRARWPSSVTGGAHRGGEHPRLGDGDGYSTVVLALTRRTLPLDSHPELVAVMERRWVAREFSRPDGTVGLSEFVFHHDGVPVLEFRKTWATACRLAAVGKRPFHDFRRTAARNMIRAGVPQTVAMSITGHKTVSMFNRYNITNQDDRREALRKTAAHVAAAPRTSSNVVRMKERAAG